MASCPDGVTGIGFNHHHHQQPNIIQLAKQTKSMKRQFSEIGQQGVWIVTPEGRKTNKGVPQPRPSVLLERASRLQSEEEELKRSPGISLSWKTEI